MASLAERLPGRRAFLTGGGSGLGLALATRLAHEGWTLGLLDREAGRLEAARAALLAAGAPAVHTFVADVTDEAGFTAAVHDFVARAGGLEFMVNNAGVAVAGSIEATPLADWRWAVDINLLGVVIGMRAALPALRAANRGLVLNIASAASFACTAQLGAYNATKAGVVAITETLAQELEGAGIRAAVAMPGFFPTNLLETARAPAAALGMAHKLMQRSDYTAERAAEAILAACARGAVHIVVPDQYRTIWRLKRLAPTWFLGWLARKRGARRAPQRGGGSTART